jgi:2-amino-4-hydroxy-6-hydroxymethyldihydropteridine diphosphokinase/dihydropteroate synthase
MKPKKPIILGVLNVSPESTWKDSIALNKKDILKRAKILKKGGADYIDVGAISSSTKSKKIDEDTELKRIIPAIKLLKDHGYRISVDTWNSNTAIKCLEQGVDMINYTSSTYPKKFLENIEKFDAWIIITYMPYKNPYERKKSNPDKFNLQKIMIYFKSKIELAKRYNIKKIILDPNLGILHPKIQKNPYLKICRQMSIINSIPKLKSFKIPIMMLAPRFNGVTNTLMVSSILNKNPEFMRTHDPDKIKNSKSKKIFGSYIGIGSNINPGDNIKEGLKLLCSKCIIVAQSNYYKTKPYGYEKQNKFINLVVKIKTNLKPYELLKNLQSIEKKLNRKRLIKNGPRTIDLDILLYGPKIINDKKLVVPHKGLLERDFMLIPLLDIAPDAIYPKTTKKIKFYKKNIKYNQILRKIGVN